MDEIKVFARRYPCQSEARQAYEEAVRTYVLGTALEAGFTLALIPGTGWIVAVVGRDASAGMLEGGEELSLPEEIRHILIQRFTQNRPSQHGRWIVRKSFPEGLCIPVRKHH